jgi:hypothetical protein
MRFQNPPRTIYLAVVKTMNLEYHQKGVMVLGLPFPLAFCHL